MFSIILPNYNHARFLHKRIQSVLNQTYRDYEIIILDDKSTDNSIEIINSYGDKRITHRVFNKENSGSPFKQWKKGLELAKYDYVWIAESDDFCDDSFLYEASEKIKHDKQLSVFYCDSNLIGENEEPYKNNIQKYTADLDAKLWSDDHSFSGREYIEKYLRHKNFILNASGVVFRKDLGIKHINEVIDYKTSGDWLFWCLILTKGNIYFSSKKLNYFRHSPQSTRNYNTLEKRERRILEKIKVQNKIFEIFNLHNHEEKLKKELLNEWIRYHNLKEILLKSYYTVAEDEFLGVSKIELIQETIKQKLNNRLLNKNTHEK